MRQILVEPAATLEQVAERLGLSKQRVQQIERVALVKLRKACARRGLALADFIDVLRVSNANQTPHYWQRR